MAEQVYEPNTLIVSTYQPGLAPEPVPLSSAPKRHLNWIFWPFAELGNSTVVVIKPLEFPVHPARPLSGLGVYGGLIAGLAAVITLL